jgi:hypothetical protein
VFFKRPDKERKKMTRRRHPFVILFYVQKLSVVSAEICFKQMRMHYPNTPVLVFRTNDAVDLLFLDDYSTIYPATCQTSLDVWKAFYKDTLHDSAILWPSHFFIGSLPLPPLLNSCFFWVHNGVVSKAETPAELSDATKLACGPEVGCTAVEDLYGYMRRSVFDDAFLELQALRSMVTLVALKKKVTHLFLHGPEHVGTDSVEYVEALKTCRAPVFQLLKSH